MEILLNDFIDAQEVMLCKKIVKIHKILFKIKMLMPQYRTHPIFYLKCLLIVFISFKFNFADKI